VDISYKQAIKTVFNVSRWHRCLGRVLGVLRQGFGAENMSVGKRRLAFAYMSVVWLEPVFRSCRTAGAKSLNRIKILHYLEARLFHLSEMSLISTTK